MIFGSKRVKPLKVQDLSDIEALQREDRPILIDFWQQGCQPCRTMDGIVTELAEEFGETAHVVKINVGRVPDAVGAFAIKSTPTFVVLGRNVKQAKKKRQRGEKPPTGMTQRWRGTGLIQKDVLARVLETNGATRES
ncbi:thioredoxin family protein [bacterium]|nr:thioredoxin family protein [bacterium]